MKTLSPHRIAALRYWVALALAPLPVCAQLPVEQAEARAGFPASGAFTVPAGAEWSEPIESGFAQVRLASRPYFGGSAKDAPIFEVGGSSVSFLRDEFGGVLVFMGEKQTILPYVIALRDDGSSRQPLDLALSYDLATGAVQLRVGAARHEFAAGSEGVTLSATLSAGTTSPWEVTSLHIDTDKAGAAAANASRPAPNLGTAAASQRPSKAEVLAETTRRKTAYAESPALYLKDKERAVRMLMAQNRHAPGTFAWHREAVVRLTHLALALRQTYELKAAAEVALRAQALLKEAEYLAETELPAHRAVVHELAGFVWEELLRSPEQAEAAYDKALANYEDAPRAKEAKLRMTEKHTLEAALAEAARR